MKETGTVELAGVPVSASGGAADRRKVIAAWRGGATAATTGGLAVGAFYAGASAWFPAIVRSLAATAPDLLPLLLPALALLAPALLALPVAAATAAVARAEATWDPDLGRAAAAGAGIGATLVAAVSLGWLSVAVGSVAGVVLLFPYFLSAAFGVGVVGAAGFGAVGNRDGEGVPALYQLLTAASLGAFGLLAAAPLWAILGWVVPALAPTNLFLSLGIVGSSALMLGALAPLTYAMARGMDRLFARPRRRALGYGLVVPALVPSLVYGWLALFYGGGVAFPLTATFLGFTLGALPHTLAVFAGLGPARRALPPGEEPLTALPPG